MAETINGAFLCAENSSNPKGSDKGPSVPEDIGKDTAKLLLEEIYKVLVVRKNNWISSKKIQFPGLFNQMLKGL